MVGCANSHVTVILILTYLYMLVLIREIITQILINQVFVLILKILVVVSRAEGVNMHTLQMKICPIL